MYGSKFFQQWNEDSFNEKPVVLSVLRVNILLDMDHAYTQIRAVARGNVWGAQAPRLGGKSLKSSSVEKLSVNTKTFLADGHPSWNFADYATNLNSTLYPRNVDLDPVEFESDFVLSISRTTCMDENKVNDDFEKISVNQQKLEKRLCTSLKSFLVMFEYDSA